jgi:hypothetical protein
MFNIKTLNKKALGAKSKQGHAIITSANNQPSAFASKRSGDVNVSGWRR